MGRRPPWFSARRPPPATATTWRWAPTRARRRRSGRARDVACRWLSTRSFLRAPYPSDLCVDWRYRARDGEFAHFARLIRRAGGLVVPAHPHCPFVACQWKSGYAHADAVEVWNGPWTADDELSLAAWDNMLVTDDDWLPAMGNSEAHREGQDVGLPQTVVHAEDLTRPALLEGIRRGRSYLAESAHIGVRLTASGPHGEHAAAHLWTDEGLMHAEPVPDSGAVTWRTTAAQSTYVRAEVRRPPPGGASPLPGPMAAMTNPVWLAGRHRH